MCDRGGGREERVRSAGVDLSTDEILAPPRHRFNLSLTRTGIVFISCAAVQRTPEDVARKHLVELPSTLF